MLRFRLTGPHHVVSNVPFGITTPLLRHLLDQRAWTTAVLMLQWEVARKRAAVGGTTLLTASWWPWYAFELAGRVPAAAFRPRPSVDAGILVLRRRDRPLLDDAERPPTSAWCGSRSPATGCSRRCAGSRARVAGRAARSAPRPGPVT